MTPLTQTLAPLSDETTIQHSLQCSDAVQELSRAFAAAVEQPGTSGDLAGLERLQALRFQFVETLLSTEQPITVLAPSVNAVASACIKSGLRSYTRMLQEEELFGRCLDAANRASPADAAVRWMAAMLMAWHAFELPDLPPLAAIPQDIRSSWLSFLLELPPAFVRPGDGERFAHYLQRVCDQVLQRLAFELSDRKRTLPQLFCPVGPLCRAISMN